MSLAASRQPVIMWFRNDLRTADHLALQEAAAHTAQATQAGQIRQAGQDTRAGQSGQTTQAGGLWCVYVRDQADQRSQLQAAALDNALFELNQNLSGRLLTLSGDPRQILPQLADLVSAGRVYASHDYTPAGAALLSEVGATLEKSGVPLVLQGDNYAVTPGTLLTGSATHYRVFTPFKKRWLAHPWERPVQSRPDPTLLADPHSLPLGTHNLATLSAKPAPCQAPKTTRVGENTARTDWADFLSDRLLDYAEARDFLAVEGTSRLSGHLAHGAIHPRTLLADLADADEAPIGRDVYASELAWREFYADFLWAQPQSGWQDVNPIFPHYPWDEDEAAFAAWREGRTGFPVVDAAMRQLAETGWMHNRARMIVASFLTKDLHQPWQVGAEYFLSQLVDADFASNQHGWQWTAGTGTDASPYFRIFNPYTQGLRFDPQGRYIYRWIPQLRSLFDTDLFGAEGESRQAKRRLKQIHYGLADGGFKPADLASGESAYPGPIVDHGEAREESLRRYKER